MSHTAPSVPLCYWFAPASSLFTCFYYCPRWQGTAAESRRGLGKSATTQAEGKREDGGFSIGSIWRVGPTLTLMQLCVCLCSCCIHLFISSCLFFRDKVKASVRRPRSSPCSSVTGESKHWKNRLKKHLLADVPCQITTAQLEDSHSYNRMCHLLVTCGRM